MNVLHLVSQMLDAQITMTQASHCCLQDGPAVLAGAAVLLAPVATRPEMPALELQGDVGSVKTVVAAVGIYAAYISGYQVALMAPTEVLAEQHFNSIKIYRLKSYFILFYYPPCVEQSLVV